MAIVLPNGGSHGYGPHHGVDLCYEHTNTRKVFLHAAGPRAEAAAPRLRKQPRHGN